MTVSQDLLADARAQLAAYLKLFPGERDDLLQLQAQFEASDPDLLLRSNMRGHITTSGIVFDDIAEKVLMIHHRGLDRWLQPGGHHEGSDPLDRSAAREVIEETGVTDLLRRPWPSAADAPFDIETHFIPANPGKAEGEHWHHDFIYLFAADSSASLSPQWAEVAGVKWMDLQVFASLPGRFERIAGKLKALV